MNWYMRFTYFPDVRGHTPAADHIGPFPDEDVARQTAAIYGGLHAQFVELDTPPENTTSPGAFVDWQLGRWQ